MKKQPIILTKPYREESCLAMPSSLIVTVVSVYILFYCTQSHALSWTLTKSVQAQEIYSDNIRLAPSGSEKGAFVTALNPGISIVGQSAVSRFNFNYRMQNLYNAGGDGGLSIYNQLQSNSHTTFIPNKLFLDSNTGISQQNINNNLIGANNINGSTNNTNVYNFGLSPYWTPRFSNYASGIARLNINTIATSGGSTSNNNFNTLSDSVNVAETINLRSGSYFQRVNWNLSFNNNENYRINNPTISFQNTNGRVGVPINAYFNVFAQGGYSSNNYQTTNLNNTGNNNSRFYYTFGGQWKPSQRFSITAGGGNNSYVTVYFSPMARLTTTTTYSNNAVGTNFGQYSPGNAGGNIGQNYPATGGGNSGQNWTTSWNYQTRRSKWTLTHRNTTTTSQQILAQNQIFPAQDLANNQLSNTDLNQRIINNPTLTDQVIVSKTWNLGVSFTPGKSTFSVNAYESDYTYQTLGNN
ncbi:MAG: TIGR03016 family PEP-CTERM system-associated outer membrane protein, partial [Methylococcaceae bacterium]|nr:TIGR03016 family PEP-CTERM system-associated outer membrane protein [Methylococcaceae bacterium]